MGDGLRQMRGYGLGYRICFVLMALLVSAMVSTPRPALAAVCRATQAHRVCIVSIKRSAKNYWEYRAAVQIDDVTRPLEIYNCRDRHRIRQDGRLVPFQPYGVGEVICNFFKR
jgi:hypothetical protein